MEGYVPKPESGIIPSRPPPAERSAEDQTFFLSQKNFNNPLIIFIHASQVTDHEALNGKTARAASSTLSMTEYAISLCS